MGSPFAPLFVHNKRRFHHGNKVREESAGQSREGDARTQTWNAEERLVGQEGEEPQTSHRHRSVGSTTRRRQRAVEEIVEEILEKVFEEIELEEIVFEEIQLEKIFEEEVNQNAGVMPALSLHLSGD
jgi:hypothetical protein